MNPYYPHMSFLAVSVALVALVMVRDNAALPYRVKRLFTMTFVFIMGATLCETLAICLNGSGPGARPVVCVASALEYGFSFMPCIFFAAILDPRPSRDLHLAYALSFAHGLIELLLCFSGAIFVVDQDANFSTGPAYLLFIVSCAVAILYLLYKTKEFSKSAQVRNRLIPWLIIGLVFCAGATHFINNGVLLIWPASAIAGVFFYLFYCSVIQQTDRVTRLLNRQAYEGRLSALATQVEIVFFDLDSFKQVNDTFGHETGDKCLAAVAQAIYEVFGKSGSCYRIGGDEFCAILVHNLDDVEMMQAILCRKLEQMRREAPWITMVSIGHARFEPGDDASAVVGRADAMMYEYKRARKAGRL